MYFAAHGALNSISTSSKPVSNAWLGVIAKGGGHLNFAIPVAVNDYISSQTP
jgi:hypothetical protein